MLTACDPGLPTFAKLCQFFDDQLFNMLLQNPQHPLAGLLTPTELQYAHQRASTGTILYNTFQSN